MMLLLLTSFGFAPLVVMTTLSTFFRPALRKSSLKSLSEKFHHMPPFLFAAPVLLPPLLEEFQKPPLLVVPKLRRRFTNARSFEKNWYGRPFTMNPPRFIVVLISSFVAVRSRLLVVVVVALLYVWW